MTTRRTFLNTIGVLSGMCMTPEVFAGQANNKLQPLLSSRSIQNSYWYIGHLMSLLTVSKQTGGEYALLRATERRGLEPPPHIHTREDETFIILEGEVEYTVADQTFRAKAGDSMFLPKNIPHSFKILSEKLETLILLTPGGLEDYFVEMSEPAKAVTLPPMPAGPPDIAKLIARASKYGVLFPAMKK
ncbi:MAG: cupin protein [Ferruginibacter sp.]|nr:cupin protein [Ferruginibacter sp.]